MARRLRDVPVASRVACPVTCALVSWAPVPTAPADLQVITTCRDRTGAPVASDSTLLFLRSLGPEGFAGGPAAYLDANRPSAAAYTPAGGAATVTAERSSAVTCQLSSIATATPQTIGVRCFTPAGAAADSRFTLAYTK